MSTPALKRAGMDTALSAATPCITLYQAPITRDHAKIHYVEMPPYENQFEKNTAEIIAAHTRRLTAAIHQPAGASCAG